MQCHHVGSRAYVAALGRMRLQTQVSLQGMVYASAIDARGKQKGTDECLLGFLCVLRLFEYGPCTVRTYVRSCFTPSPLR